MYKSFLILAVLVLFGTYSDRAAGQTTRNKDQTQADIKKPNNPTDSVATIMPAPGVRNAEAEELYKAGIRRTDEGDFSRAVENLQQALGLDPGYAEAYAALGRAYFKMREWEKAVVNLRRAAELNTKRRALANVDAAKTLTPTSATTRQTEQPTKPKPAQPKAPSPLSSTGTLQIASASRPRYSAPQKAIPIAAKIKQSQETNLNAVVVKPSSTPSATPRPPELRLETSTPAKVLEIQPPPKTDGYTAAVEPPRSEATRQPQQQAAVTTAARANPNTPPVTPAKEVNSDAADLKPSSTPSATLRPPELRLETSTPAKVPEIKPPQKTNGDTAALEPPSPGSETTRQPEPQAAVSTAAKANPNTPPVTPAKEVNSNAAEVKPASTMATSRPPELRLETSTPAKVPEIKPPPKSNGNTAAVEPPRSETTRQPEPQAEVSTAAKANPNTPPVTPAKEANSNPPEVKPSSTPSATPRPPELRLETSTPAKVLEIKPPPKTNGNTAAVEPPRSEATRQPQQQAKVGTSAKANPNSPQAPPAKEANSNPAEVTTANTILATSRPPELRLETSTPAKVLEIKPPPKSNGNTAAVEPPRSEATLQPQQQAKVSTAAKANPNTPPVTPAKEDSNAAEVKPASTMATSRPPELRLETSTPAKVPEIKLPQKTNGDSAALEPPSPRSEATRQPQQQAAVSTAAQVIPNSPQVAPAKEANSNPAEVKPLLPESEREREPEAREEANPSATLTPKSPEVKQEAGNAVEVKPPSPESNATRQPERTVEAPPELKNNDLPLEQKLELPGARVAMVAASPPAPPGAESVIPTPVKVPVGDTSLTRIYRIGPSDVLDVRLNDSQSPRSTLLTVSPTGLLEHPMLTEPLLVKGFTVEEIGTKIEIELSKRALLDNAKVAVGVRDYASHSILVSGLVKDPGTKFLRREAIPLYVVVADAQPLPEAARVTVARNETSRIYDIDLTQPAEMQLLVRSGDVITLHRNVTQFIYIGGEVKFPGEKMFRRGLTLMQAVIAAGGVNTKSKAAEIARDDGRGFLVGMDFDLQDIQSGKAVDPLLKPGDRIMVLRETGR